MNCERSDGQEYQSRAIDDDEYDNDVHNAADGGHWCVVVAHNPYLISAHPQSWLKVTAHIASKLSLVRINPESLREAVMGM